MLTFSVHFSLVYGSVLLCLSDLGLVSHAVVRSCGGWKKLGFVGSVVLRMQYAVNLKVIGRVVCPNVRKLNRTVKESYLGSS